MYQFYYAHEKSTYDASLITKNVRDELKIKGVRPSVWEEHCLECSAPLCFRTCPHYESRSDGRCKRFVDGLREFEDNRACCGRGVHIAFRKWANMMTELFPTVQNEEDAIKLSNRNQSLGKNLKRIESGILPRAIRWQSIRTIEFLRRRRLRGMRGEALPNYFVFHGYNHSEISCRMVVEFKNEQGSVYKFSFPIDRGENLHIEQLSVTDKILLRSGTDIKFYPENDAEIELDILWCDFVFADKIEKATPAPKVKCVVWDLDNTLWDGILIETENPDELKLCDGVEELIHELDNRGIIQSIASKNDYENTWAVLKKKGLDDYFLYPQIHWNAKSGSIEQIAKQLNIGIDTLALIDDSVFERNQVQSVLPQVRAYDATEVKSLYSYPEFDVPITDESKKRRSLYQAEEKRTQMQMADGGDILSFLKSCHLKIRIFEPKTDAETLRCFELTVRTNQLNMSGNKYSRGEFDTILQMDGKTNFAFECEDDFGSYGIVGFGQYHVVEGVMHFDEFAMSCRVAGKYVESALFSELLRRENAKSGFFKVRKTKKNTLLRRTLFDIGFKAQEENAERIMYRFAADLKCKDVVSVDQK